MVVCSRNDDHGGEMLRRMQAFVDNLSMQCEKFRLSAELVIVEWNPPDDRPSLAKALVFPRNAYIAYRIVEVPHSIHVTFRSSESLPLFQMIAKNVGIRASRGSFVLCTNIDILFPDEVMSFLATKSLKQGSYYRVNRYDVPYDTPMQGSPKRQLDYAKAHVVRVNVKEYTLEPESGTIQWIYFRWRGLKQMQTILWFSGPLFVTNFIINRYSKEIVDFSERRKRKRVPLIPWGSLGRFRERLDRARAKLRDPLDSSPLLRINEIAVELLAAPPPALPPLFTNASGDFTLMSREDWFRLRGYAEFEMYSLHIDSLLLYAAYFGGMKEVVLKGRVFHIDHSMGWSPMVQSERAFNDKMGQKGVQVLSWYEVLGMVEKMRGSMGAYLLNDEEWGLNGVPLQITDFGGDQAAAGKVLLESGQR